MMTKSSCRSFIAIAVLWLLGWSILLSACSGGGKDDTEAIRRLIGKGIDLAEEKELSDLMDLTTDDFVANPGEHDARSAKRVLLGAFLHYGKFKIHNPKPTVEVADEGDRATAAVYFLIVRKDQEIPGLKALYDDPRQWFERVKEKADLYELKLDLVRGGRDWKVKMAAVEGFKGTHF